MKLSKPIHVEGWQKLSERYQSYLQYSLEGRHAMYLDKSEFEFIASIVNPSFEQFLGTDFVINECIMFFVRPKTSRGIHLDNTFNEQKHVKSWVLNIPILNTNDSHMQWYQGDYTQELFQRPNGLLSYRTRWNSEPNLIEEYTITEPTLVCVDYPHDVTNHGDEHRVMLSVRTTPYIMLPDPLME